MGAKYNILARNYKDEGWMTVLYTNSKFEAIKVWIKALLKYELVEFTIRK